jgi:ribose 5-phosphate isomerase A
MGPPHRINIADLIGSQDQAKQAAAQAVVILVRDGMRVGLGTGDTVGHLLPLLRGHARNATYVATSPRTEQIALELGLNVLPFDTFDRLDLAIDSADQIAPSGWLVKGGGGAHTREKIVAAAAERFVVIASADKLVDELAPPIPLELLPFGAAATVGSLAPARLRPVPPSPDGGLIGDYYGSVDDPAVVAARLSNTPGLVEHGLFPPELVSDILAASGSGVEKLTPRSKR